MVWIEIAVMFLVMMAAWAGLALAKASAKRERSERAAIDARLRKSFPEMDRKIRAEIRSDVHRRYAARVAEFGHPSRPMWLSTYPARPTSTTDRMAENGLGGDAA